MILNMGFHGSLMSLMSSFFLDWRSVWKFSVHAARIWYGMPGVVHMWKYKIASLFRFSFGMGYPSILQLFTNKMNV